MYSRKKKTKKYYTKRSNNSGTKKYSKLVGSVSSSSNPTILVEGKDFAGINGYSQLTLNGPYGPLYGEGIQLWGPKSAEGYVKNYTWDGNPKNFQIQRWKINSFGAGKLNKYLPNSKLKVKGDFQIIDAAGKLAKSKGQKGNFSMSFSHNGNNFIGMSYLT